MAVFGNGSGVAFAAGLSAHRGRSRMTALVNVALAFQKRYFAQELRPAPAAVIAGAEEACPPPRS
ncbi:MAG: hypothetical protein R2838_19020 [Caldilineaceae bacterium]